MRWAALESPAFVACGFALLLVGRIAQSEQLPIRAYGPADGFPSKVVNGITRDSHGYLWFATREGLARFDGYEFHTYRRADGLPRDSVNAFLETRSGVYWAATSEGLARFDPNAAPAKKFTVYYPDDTLARFIRVLYEDRSGQVWCGTNNGLYRLQKNVRGPEWKLELVPLMLESGKPAAHPLITSLFDDSRGNLWKVATRYCDTRPPRLAISRRNLPWK